MKMITGLLEMTSGEILFDGVHIQGDLIAWKQRMGYVPEDPRLYGHLTGLEYLVMVGQLRGLPNKPTFQKIDGLLRLFSRTETGTSRIVLLETHAPVVLASSRS
jgi:ABC-2 type transport system ATP-binding protein